MTGHDPRVDAYIANAAAFARPVLEHLRAVVHAACPEVEESIKWSAPHFLYRGRLFCHMAAFKHHAAFGFRHGARLLGDDCAMGQFGRIESLADLPPRRTLAGYVKKAMVFADGDAAPTRAKKPPKPPVETPPDLAAALAKNRKAQAAFDAFSPSHRREYVEWIVEAKRAETREKRIATALEWLADGKSRNWKYEKR